MAALVKCRCILQKVKFSYAYDVWKYQQSRNVSHRVIYFFPFCAVFFQFSVFMNGSSSNHLFNSQHTDTRGLDIQSTELCAETCNCSSTMPYHTANWRFFHVINTRYVVRYTQWTTCCSSTNPFPGSFPAPTLLRPLRSDSCDQRSRLVRSLPCTAHQRLEPRCNEGQMHATAAARSDRRPMTEVVAMAETLHTMSSSSSSLSRSLRRPLQHSVTTGVREWLLLFSYPPTSTK